MPYISVKFDMFDIDTRDLVNEVCRRLKGESKAHRITTIQLNQIIASINTINNEKPLPDKTLEDRLKTEHLQKIWEKYPSHIIEKLLP